MYACKYINYLSTNNIEFSVYFNSSAPLNNYYRMSARLKHKIAEQHTINSHTW